VTWFQGPLTVTGVRWGRLAAAVVAVGLVAVAFVRLISPADDAEAIQATITRYASSSDPHVCLDLVTQSFLDQVDPRRGSTAVADCERAVKTEPRGEPKVLDVRVTDDRAFARVYFGAGGLAGATVDMTLVRYPDGWRLDRITHVVALDSGRFADSYVERARLRSDALSGRDLTCIHGAAASISAADLEEVGLGEAQVNLATQAIACDRSAAERSVHAQAVSGLPSQLVDCYMERVRSLSDRDLAELGFDPAEYGRVLARCDPDAVVAAITQRIKDSDSVDRAIVPCVDRRLHALNQDRIATLVYANDELDRAIEECEGSS
jgi:hypothetical protein